MSKQVQVENCDLKQQIIFIGRPEENNATMFFTIEKKGEATFDFSQISVDLLNDFDNESSMGLHSKFPIRKWYIINNPKMDNMVEDMKMI